MAMVELSDNRLSGMNAIADARPDRGTCEAKCCWLCSRVTGVLVEDMLVMLLDAKEDKLDEASELYCVLEAVDESDSAL